MRTVFLKGRGDFTEWRDAARALLQADIEPQAVDWRLAGEATLLEGAGEPQPMPEPLAAAGKAVAVPAAFLALAQSVVCHTQPARFALLYRLLFRLRHERQLLEIVSDADVIEALRLEKSVRRDSHKMKAFVRFKEVPGEKGPRRSFVAWFEPDHFIVARTAPFFARRFADMDWLIATPKGSATFNGEGLVVSDQPAEKLDRQDVADDLWRVYYANIFNPARLKVKAMTAEMPKKYWKNLPEASLIPGLIAQAEEKVKEMAEKAASQPPLFHARLRERAATALLADPPHDAPSPTLAGLRRQAEGCTRCPLHCNATQTVFGEGPERADIMVVGEQPGDQEDLAGRAFVGPAGKLFDGVLSEIGIDRQALYVTNAVKHFKYEPRGKRRIHQKPNQGEIEACRWWLGQEVDLVQPKLVVAMGASAYFSLTGEKRPLSEVRGKMMSIGEDRRLLVTVHPSYLLRLQEGEVQRRERQLFQNDLRGMKEYFM
ncbi:DNA polymerase [Neorhizobium galegae]|uniref:UdgX family uracil-DNA binding protein n=1 Tax=Neorhizobium galegae TaxID=399 RepID=UPI001AEB7926|nr:UdgX family uracil-DNA binding protein [Neorhizobium galegae]MBP2548916.1 DNA polymerase [Neorhizobium galegae]